MNKKIFISYSHQNMEWAQENGYNLIPWLESQLAPEGISVWWDKDLTRMPGIEYEQRIYSKIDEADLAILLISQEYAASSFIRCKEEPHIKARYERGELMILPLMISPISNMYKNNRLSWIFDLQIFPEATKPLIDIVKDKSRWESTKVDLLDGIYNRVTSTKKVKGTATEQNVGAKPTPKLTANTNANNNSSTELDVLRQEIERLKAEISQKQETPQISKEEAYKIGDDYYFGKNGKSQDYIEAVKWYLKSAEQGDAYAQNDLGYCYDKGLGVSQDYAEAIKWYRKAAEQGYAVAQNGLGFCYYNGQGVTQDYAEAVKWYRKAAEQGDAYAQLNLGYCYDNGQGVTQDYAEAVKWYRKAAEQSDADAQYKLGYYYKYDKQDYAEAVKWYRKAAEQGNASAQISLGYCYKYGDGVEKDINKAIKLWRQAARQGDKTAQEILWAGGNSW